MKKKNVNMQNLSASPSKSRTKSRDESVMDWPTPDLSQFININSTFHTMATVSHKRSKSGIETKPWHTPTNLDLLSDASQQPSPAVFLKSIQEIRRYLHCFF